VISYYEKFRLIDEGKSKDFFAEVNWNKKDKSSKDCKLIKFTFPNGEEAVVKRELLNSLLFSISRADEQREMIPVKIQPVHWKTVQVSIKATKDICKGEDIIMNPFKISVPCDQVKDIMGIDNWKKEVDKLNGKSKGIIGA
jgi:hypothetical protein